VTTQKLEPLRNFEAWQQSVRNFEAWLKGTKAPGAMDVDALIERRGQFLVFEGKPWTNGVSFGYGQHLALQALAKVENFTVYLIGESDDGTRWLMPYSESAKPITSRKNGKLTVWWQPKCFLPVDTDYLKKLVDRWWDAADN
jgi:hypothetical protein